MWISCISASKRSGFLFHNYSMPLLKEDKKLMAQQYVELLKGAKNVVVIQHQWVPVNQINDVRMDLEESKGVLQIVKKRVFVKWIQWLYEWFKVEDVSWSVAVIVSNNEEDQHAPLKVMQKHIKQRKKQKSEYSVSYIWGWYDTEWKWSSYVTELADLPTKEELVWKFLFMLHHPVSSFARVLKAISDDSWELAKDSVETVEK